MNAHKPVRRAQLISPFGVGAMVDFPGDESLMTAGLEAWPHARSDCPPDWLVIEERLQERLGMDHFRLPPDYRSKETDPRYNGCQIPFVRFPRWHYCPMVTCGRMVRRNLFSVGNAVCDAAVHDNQSHRFRPRPLPVRFVAVCPSGHIEDFPFLEWVHGGSVAADGREHHLRYQAGSKASLDGIRISCSCGKAKTMAGAFNYDVDSGGALSKQGYLCRGNQPWLGLTDQDSNGCGDHLRVVQRGGANVYFPRTYSSIYLPLWGEKQKSRLIKVIEDPKIWGTLSSGLEDGNRISAERCATVADIYGLDAAELRKVAQRRIEGQSDTSDQSETEFRRSEYDAIRESRGDAATDLMVEARNIDDYEEWLSQYFEKICLVRKLRETRVLQGFSRLLPLDADDNETTSSAQPLSRHRNLHWLPATIVRGEGIFLELKSSTIDAWLQLPGVSDRAHKLLARYNRARVSRGLESKDFGAKFVLLHTLAHIVIRQLSYDCGYGSAALRERLYCEGTDETDQMQGILIYTAAGDSEGTMGGLVRQGEPGNFEATLYSGILSSRWCSSDPVCIESEGQGTDSSNLAACHACVLLPETSCEEGNRILDRALLCGTPERAEIGFFKDI